ncbi:hypothetical protein ACWCRD_02710 [Streptomyces sp. NPDC002092]
MIAVLVIVALVAAFGGFLAFLYRLARLAFKEPAMPPRQLHLHLDDEFARLLALYTRAGETPRQACLIALRTRALADGLLGADGKPKPLGRPPGRRP